MTRKSVDESKKYNCIEVKQGFGIFYACSIPAIDLLQICEPIRAEVLDEEIENDPLDMSIRKSSGTQRQLGKSRPEQIKEYIQTGVAAFPNSIIIGANISDSGYLLDIEDRTWKFDKGSLLISAGALSAAIIDGQHRLAGFEKLAKNEPALQDELLCSIYLDIPMTYHAQIFSSINSTQRRVPKNLIYQLYQIDMDEKSPRFWSPEVLSVYLSRALGSDKDSVLKDHVVLALDNENIKKEWNISLASLVEGILKFISENPKRDRDSFYSKKMESKVRKDVGNDRSVWRTRYIEMLDKSTYEDIKFYLNACYSVFDEGSTYRSSIGCSALLDALRILLEKPEIEFDYIKQILKSALSQINQSDLPKEKVTKSKSILRDVILASIIKCSEKKTIEHQFYRKELIDFDKYIRAK